MRGNGRGSLADDYTSALFAQNTPFLGLGAVIATLLALEKSKHATRALALGDSRCVGINGQCRVLTGKVRPAAASVKRNLYTAGGTCYSVAVGRSAPGDVFASIVGRRWSTADWLGISRLVAARCAHQSNISCRRGRHGSISSNGPWPISLSGLQRRRVSRMLGNSSLGGSFSVSVAIVNKPI